MNLIETDGVVAALLFPGRAYQSLFYSTDVRMCCPAHRARACPDLLGVVAVGVAVL